MLRLGTNRTLRNPWLKASCSMMRNEGATIGRTAAAAYRRDVVGREGNEAFGERDGSWLVVTSLIEHAARVPADDADALLSQAVDLAAVLLDDPAIPQIHQTAGTVRGGRSTSEMIRLLAEQIEEIGALNLALAMLDAVTIADRSASVLERGRTLALSARITWKMGDLDRALGTYKRVARLGKVEGESELIARARIGYATIAQLRGNFPAVRRWAGSAARLAKRSGYRRLERTAHHGLMVAAAMARRFDDAIVHGWTVYELAEGDPIAMAEVMTNLGQLLLDAGYAEPSRAAFAAVLANSQPARIGLAALGGFAGAAALVGDHKSVRWAAKEMTREAVRAKQPFPMALGLTECADALFSIGEHRAGERCRLLALAVAEKHGYHEIAFRAEGLAQRASKLERPEVAELAQPARRVTRKIEALYPPLLPKHVAFIVAT